MTSSSARIQDINKWFFLADIPLVHCIEHIHRADYVLLILAFLLFHFSQKLSYFVFGSLWTPFFKFQSWIYSTARWPRLEMRLINGTLPTQPTFQSNIPLINLISKPTYIYLWIKGILLPSPTVGQRQRLWANEKILCRNI